MRRGSRCSAKEKEEKEKRVRVLVLRCSGAVCAGTHLDGTEQTELEVGS